METISSRGSPNSISEARGATFVPVMTIKNAKRGTRDKRRIEDHRLFGWSGL